MKILLLLSESWNDRLAPNNNMTNWFSDFSDVKIWTISGDSGLPENQCCKDYFQIGELQMLKSILTRKKVGQAKHFSEYPQGGMIESNNKKTNNFRKGLKNLFSGEIMRFFRDLVWRYGRYNIEAMREFVSEFQPDIVFTQRRGSIKMCRLEQIVSEITDAPIVAYTGDDEYSLSQFSLSPMFWIRRLWVRSWLKKTIPNYRLFYCQSERQMKEFTEEFGVKTKFLVKCGNFELGKNHQYVGETINMVYAGKLYCNRWKTLVLIADEVAKINKELDSVKFKLNIYTTDNVTRKQNQKLNDGVASVIHGAIPSSEIPKVYQKSDIVLHIESFDLKNRLLTKDSFSTKVMDCLASGCAVMAVCWEGHAAYKYLREHDAALVADSRKKINLLLHDIALNPSIILDYSKKAYFCGKEKHQREKIQQMLKQDFQTIIMENIC